MEQGQVFFISVEKTIPVASKAIDIVLAGEMGSGRIVDAMLIFKGREFV